MRQYDVVVIGAGNGGLTAAAGLAKKGFKTLLLERHNVPGGCATSFVRGRFEFEVALHQLSGIGLPEFPGPLRRLLMSLKAHDKLEFVEQQNLYRYVIPGVVDITLPTSRHGVEKVLCERFPEEKEGIKKLFDTIYTFCNEMVGALYMMDPDASPEKYPTFFKLALKDAQIVLDSCIKDPLLQQIVGIYWSYAGQPPSRLSFMDFAQMIWAYIEFKPWHIKGGSQALSNAIFDSYLEFGGEARFNCGAKRINLAGGRVAAVITDNDEEIPTRCVVSNANPITTLVDLVGPENCPPEELKKFNARSVGVSAFSLYLGLTVRPKS